MEISGFFPDYITTFSGKQPFSIKAPKSEEIF